MKEMQTAATPIQDAIIYLAQSLSALKAAREIHPTNKNLAEIAKTIRRAKEFLKEELA